MKKTTNIEIDLMEFFKSIGDELDVVKNRVRHLIGSNHWGEEGRYKEAVLRSVMQKFLPKDFSIGTGFVLANDYRKYRLTSQIDIIIYDNKSPLLFQEGDFVIVTPSSVKAIIEVKTKITSNKFESIVKNIIRNAKMIRTYQADCKRVNAIGQLEDAPEGLFIGLFSYECSNTPEFFLKKLKTIYSLELSNQKKSKDEQVPIERYFINNITLSKDIFLLLKESQYDSYRMENLAYSFFIINLLKSLNFLSMWKDLSIWFVLDLYSNTVMKETTVLNEYHA